MNRWHILLLLILPLGACSVFGGRTCLEQNEHQHQWTVWKHGGGMYSPETERFSLCDSAGFISLEFADSPYVISWGPMLLPVIPWRIYGNTPPSSYRAIVSLHAKLDAKEEGITPDVLSLLHFAFNSPQNTIVPRFDYTASYTLRERRPPCTDTAVVADSLRPWLLRNSAKFVLEFDIHPDSVTTIFITADAEFTTRTGIAFSDIQLHRSNSLYYMPFTFFAH